MKLLAQGAYTALQVGEALHYPDGSREVRFRYDLLSNQLRKIGSLDVVRTGSIDHVSGADIQRTAKFDLKDKGDINFLSDRIQPFMELKVGDVWLAWPLGVFALSSPVSRSHTEGVGLRSVDAYDQNLALASKITDRLVVGTGENIVTRIESLMSEAGIISFFTSRSDMEAPTPLEWPPGTTRAEIIAALSSSINYSRPWFNSSGAGVIQPYQAPTDRGAEYTYATNASSVMYPQAERALDLFDTPNQWTLVVSGADAAPLRSVYTNDNPNSPTSTVSRGFVVSDYRTDEIAVDQATLDAKALRIAHEASQIYEEVSFETATMPHHEHRDVLKVQFDSLAVNAIHLETGWSMNLSPGGRMTHKVRRLVQV